MRSGSPLLVADEAVVEEAEVHSPAAARVVRRRWRPLPRLTMVLHRSHCLLAHPRPERAEAAVRVDVGETSLVI